MKRLIVCLAMAALAGCTTPYNLTLLKYKETAYHDSGRYMAQFTSVAQAAQRYLPEAVKQAKPGEKLAIVFDIDETCLSNWVYLQSNDYAIEPRLFEPWANRSEDAVLAPTFALYQEARRLGVTVFFITGRSENIRGGTARNLARAGYKDYAALYLKPMSYAQDSIVPYKSGMRRAIEAQGYKIILNIGDQWSDLEGGYAQRSFKLPNPFYYLP